MIIFDAIPWLLFFVIFLLIVVNLSIIDISHTKQVLQELILIGAYNV